MKTETIEQLLVKLKESRETYAEFKKMLDEEAYKQYPDETQLLLSEMGDYAAQANSKLLRLQILLQNAQRENKKKKD
jgi:hypothetical protein